MRTLKQILEQALVLIEYAEHEGCDLVWHSCDMTDCECQHCKYLSELKFAISTIDQAEAENAKLKTEVECQAKPADDERRPATDADVEAAWTGAKLAIEELLNLAGNANLKAENAKLKAELAEANAKIERLKLVQFSPIGDNHHNAAECPHCGDPLGKLRTQRDRLVELLDEKDKLIAEYFAEYDCPVGRVGKYCTNSEVEQNCKCHGGDYDEEHCPESTVCWLAILKSRRAENLQPEDSRR
jgi:hypothetical protein